jgi:murein DD-endopeptidase MepM/ murein hydrolase activator NlpD
MKMRGVSAGGFVERLRVVLGHLGRGFSFIIAPHGTGTTVSFSVPGRLAVLLAVLVVVIVVGFAFVGLTYTRLAFLAFEADRLRAENRSLRLENRKIERIEEELIRIDQVRQQIEAWAGVVPRDSVSEVRTEAFLMPREWPRRYSYALMQDYHTSRGALAQGMIQPVGGWVSRGFVEGSGNSPGHPGIDIAASTGTPVRSALGGIVKWAGWDDIYGNLIEVEHNDSLSTIYGHNDKILVKEGEYVTRGQAIATVGNTGRSTAPHLHFEILKNGRPCDPEDFLVFKNE